MVTCKRLSSGEQLALAAGIGVLGGCVSSVVASAGVYRLASEDPELAVDTNCDGSTVAAVGILCGTLVTLTSYLTISICNKNKDSQ